MSAVAQVFNQLCVDVDLFLELTVSPISMTKELSETERQRFRWPRDCHERVLVHHLSSCSVTLHKERLLWAFFLAPLAPPGMFMADLIVLTSPILNLGIVCN